MNNTPDQPEAERLPRYDLENTSLGYEAHYEMVREDECGDWVRHEDVKYIDALIGNVFRALADAENNFVWIGTQLRPDQKELYRHIQKIIENLKSYKEKQND